jgi:hypothetical protein
LTVLRAIEDRLRGLVVALADQVQPLVPAAHHREMLVAALLGTVAAFVEATEDRDRQAGIEAVAGHHDSVGTGDGLGNALQRLLGHGVVHRPSREHGGRIPTGGEQRIARRQRIGRLAGEAGIFAGERQPAGVGDHLEEELAQEGRPASLRWPAGEIRS